MALPAPVLMTVGYKIMLVAEPTLDGSAKQPDGSPIPFQGTPTWTADDNGKIVTLTPAGTSCTVATVGALNAAGPVGLVTVTCSIVGQDPTNPVVFAVRIEVVSALADGLNIRTGQPVPQ